jgi:ABC-type multidrug transport system fused ATPase/permease subunit
MATFARPNLLGIIRSCRKASCFVGISSLIALLLLYVELTYPLIIARLIDGGSSTEPIKKSVIILSCLLAIRAIASAFQSFLLEISGSEYIGAIRLRTVRNSVGAPFAVAMRRVSDEVVSIVVNDTAALRQVLSTGIGTTLYEVIKLLCAATIMMHLNARLGVIMLVAAPITTLSWRSIVPKLSSQSESIQAHISKLGAALGEVWRNFIAVKSYGCEIAEAQRIGVEIGAVVDAERHLARSRTGLDALTDLLSSGSLVVLLGAGVWQIRAHELTSGILIAFIFYAQHVNHSMSGLAKIVKDAATALGASRSVEALLHESALVKQETPSAGKVTDLDAIKRSVSVDFHDVSFSYGAKRVLERLSLSVGAGEWVVLEGPNGVGKTTILNLVMTLMPPDSGEIKIDGMNTKILPPEYVRRLVSYVPQHPYLLNRSIRENLLIGRADATADDLEMAIDAVGLKEYVENLQCGINTIIGEAGLKLSGGERQKLMIARAWLRQSPLLVLDEPSNNLDRESVKDLKERLSRAFAGRTVVISTHDESLLELANRVVSLNHRISPNENGYQYACR